MRRRTLFPLAGSAMLYAARPAAEPAAPLLSAPIELRGDWGASPERAVSIVLTRARDACLSDVRLVSDRQPAVLRVDEHTDGPPHIWLHRAEPSVAWIIVDIGPLDWCKLAYQFGHELGHVLANSWGADAAPRNPSQWLEEALVESFSIRGLGRLADGWAAEPPFAGNAAFADAIRRYRQDILERYAAVAAEQGGTGNLSAWFRVQRAALEDNGSIGGPARGLVPLVVALLQAEPGSVEALGALNRWPARTGVPLEEYLRLWKRSCAELGASQFLPIRLRRMLLG